MRIRTALFAALWLGSAVSGMAQIGLTLAECETAFGKKAFNFDGFLKGMGGVPDPAERHWTDVEGIEISVDFKNKGRSNKAVYSHFGIPLTEDGDFSGAQLSQILSWGGINPDEMEHVRWPHPGPRTKIEVWVSNDRTTVLVYRRTKTAKYFRTRKITPRIEILDNATFRREYKR